MRLMVTDSGLGGLSVFAGLEQAMTAGKIGSGIELLYVNAAPDAQWGYNSLKTRAERIALFDRFLHGAYARYRPDEIAIACNTLSVIYDETDFARASPIKVKGIVDAGVEMCSNHLDLEPDHAVIIFATPATTEVGTYPRLIQVESSRIVAQACPNLPNAISKDATGLAARQILKKYIPEALAKFDEQPQSVFAFLGCTHFGYQTEVFKEIIEELGITVKILNPNDLLLSQLIASKSVNSDDSKQKHKLRFISSYEVPQTEIGAMEHYLKETAPLTFEALINQIVVPDLFASA